MFKTFYSDKFSSFACVCVCVCVFPVRDLSYNRITQVPTLQACVRLQEM